MFLIFSDKQIFSLIVRQKIKKKKLKYSKVFFFFFFAFKNFRFNYSQKSNLFMICEKKQTFVMQWKEFVWWLVLARILCRIEKCKYTTNSLVLRICWKRRGGILLGEGIHLVIWADYTYFSWSLIPHKNTQKNYCRQKKTITDCGIFFEPPPKIVIFGGGSDKKIIVNFTDVLNC